MALQLTQNRSGEVTALLGLSLFWRVVPRTASLATCSVIQLLVIALFGLNSLGGLGCRWAAGMGSEPLSMSAQTGEGTRIGSAQPAPGAASGPQALLCLPFGRHSTAPIQTA